jgi:hypothetical protein
MAMYRICTRFNRCALDLKRSGSALRAAVI